MRFTRPVQPMAAVALVAFLAPANAAPPSTINYQATSPTPPAQPVNNGAITMTFSFTRRHLEVRPFTRRLRRSA